MSSDLQGRVVLVTGGSRGIGAAITAALVREGARVCVAARTREDVEAQVEQLRALAGDPGAAVGICADVTREDQVETLFSRCEDELGPLYGLVNNAGNAPVGPTADFSLEEWRRCIDLNLTGAFLCSREAFRRMPAHGGGAIVNISSGAGKHGKAQWAAYCAAKSGLHGLARALSEEGVELNIRVNTVCPGGTRTELRWSLFGDEPEGTILEPDEVAEATLFLLSSRAAQVRGAELDVRQRRPA